MKFKFVQTENLFTIWKDKKSVKKLNLENKIMWIRNMRFKVINLIWFPVLNLAMEYFFENY